MFSGFKSSILSLLALTIGGASVIAAIASTLGHYFFTAEVIQQSTDQQILSALELTTDYLEKNYTEKLKYDLKLIESSQEINFLISSSADEYLIHQLNVEKLLLSFSKNRSDLYRSIRLVGVSGSEIAIIEQQKRMREYNTITMSGKSQTINTMGELFLDLKSSKPGSILFANPVFENGETYYFVGLAKTDPDIGGFGGAVIITFTLDQFIKYLNNFKVFGYSLVWLYSSEGELIYRGDTEISIDPYPYIFKGEEKPDDLTILPDISSLSDPKTDSELKPSSDRSSISSIVKTFIVFPPEARNQLLKNLGAVTALILTSIIFTSLLLAYIMAKRIVNPIRRLTYMSKKVAAGDFSVKMPVKGQDEISSLSQSFNIMTRELEGKRIELITMANMDILTKLPNRRQFDSDLIQSIRNCQRNEEAIAVIYVDLDQFKDTNDSFGHPAGDKLIQDVAKRLSSSVRQTDLVARLGGDEFAIILNQHKSRYHTE
ncbi:MAG: HAMP domain-containing protein, partial [Cellvibrionaceae bacterium]